MTSKVDVPLRVEETGRKVRTGRWLAVAAGALIGLAAIGLYAWRGGGELEELAALGYPGVFLVMLLSGASIFLPAPG